jgi:hypothetical protein
MVQNLNQREIDSFNSILTQTVAMLFRGSQSDLAADNQSQSSLGNLDSIMTPSSMKSEIPSTEIRGQQLQPPSQNISQWLQVDAKQKLKESMIKIGIDVGQVSGNHLQNYSVKALENEKRRVKNELKIYDQQFSGQFGRMPDKDEKQPMKPLYMYYKRLKMYIDRKSSMAAASQNINQTASRGSSVDSTALSQGSRLSQQPAEVVVKPTAVLNPEEAAPQAEKVLQKYLISNKLELQKKVHDLKSERAKLRQQLDLFQKNFIESNNRKIKYTTDIQPVQGEFKRYKDLKSDIIKLEEVTSFN